MAVQLSSSLSYLATTRRLPRRHVSPSSPTQHRSVAPRRCIEAASSVRNCGLDDSAVVSRRRAGCLAALLMAAAGSSVVAIAPLSATAASNPSESSCESCSNSNSSMQEGDKSFVTTPSGLRYLDLKPGTGAAPSPGQLCVVDWVGYTAGYQAKRIESTRETDEPYRFRLGKGEAIAAFDEAVAGMKVGGVRRVEIPGELEEVLGYSKDYSVRYVRGPEPTTFGGKRALDFVLDNKTLRDFNRTLLFDIRLDNVVQ